MIQLIEPFTLTPSLVKIICHLGGHKLTIKATSLMLWAVVHLKKLLLTVKPHVQPCLISNQVPY